MARLFVTDINLNKNELQNARIQGLGSAPLNPVTGQIYYNTSDNKMYYYNGLLAPNGPWVTMSGSDEVIQDVVSDAIIAGVGLDKTYDDEAGTLTLDIDSTVVTKTDTQTLTNKTYEDPTFKDRVSFTNNSDNETMYIEHSGTGTNRIVSSDDLSLRSQNGDIILYPGSDASWGGDGGYGKAYVGWGNDATSQNPQNEIATIGNAQVFTNKTINDELYFTNPSTIPNDGGIKINDATEDFEIRAYVADLNLYSNNGDINLDADGDVNITAPLNIYGNLRASNIYGENTNGDGSISLHDGSNTSTIQINGDTKNIELITGGTGKAYYGSSATAGNEIAKLADLQALSSGLDWKTAVNVHIDSAEATAMGLSVDNEFLTSTIIGGVLQIDGHNINNANAGYRILVTGTNSTKDGIWAIQSVAELNWIAVRTEDADTFAELVGAAVFVMEGTKYAATSWVQNDHYITNFVGQTWIQFSGQGTYIGSDSILIDGRQVSVIADTTRAIAVDEDGVYTKIDGSSGIAFNESGSLSVKLGTGLVFNGSGNITNDTANGYGVRKVTGTVGDGLTTSFTFTHNLGTRYVTVQIFEASGPYGQVEADVEHTDANTATIRFASAPATGEYEVVVVG
jgi:hypothetical protein